MTKASIPKGTRDFLPAQMAKRRFLFQSIESVFKKYGFSAIETPAMENLSTLTGKYGDEGDKLLFKVLNNGDYLSKANPAALTSRDSNALLPSISKRGLRYDLTVPFARFVAMHQNDLAFPFKRYQIQPVWRADRPQKGRYQEFYQCDVDVVGSPSLMYEAEVVHIYDEVFKNLGINVAIKINNRKVLYGLAEITGLAKDFGKFAVIIDKLDKIGPEKVKAELSNLGVDIKTSNRLFEIFQITSLTELKDLFEASPTGLAGIQELSQFHDYFDKHPHHNQVKLDLTLARGLGYYTGCIFEVTASDISMGSLGGGGRYDNLTGSFGLSNMSGIGISFGAERIYDVMEELDLFSHLQLNHLKAIFIARDIESHFYSFKYASLLRSRGISVEVYPDPVKMSKQMKYANARDFKYAIIIGEEERSNDGFSVKDLKSGEQNMLTFSELEILLA